ncbi:hypothetical protein ACFVJH_34035 [Streptomyces decoyicus]|uniref:hypothetical protein n=1 Tax=Streptomyces decoyicus TaxID=249567 RepID=UPI003627783E
MNKIFEALHQLEAALRLMSAMRTIAPGTGLKQAGLPGAVCHLPPQHQRHRRRPG